MKLPTLELFTRKQEISFFEKCIKDKGSKRFHLKILEAGCGRRWPLNLGKIKYKLVGIDTDEVALKIRKNKVRDIDEIIIGDLRYIDLGENEYDVIYNCCVLEHIDDAKAVLDNFFKWLKPGGILLLRFPDRNSVYGFITRKTPFWVHVFYKKYIKGNPNAGKPGYDPYPTYYNPILTRRGIHEFCAQNGFEIRGEYGREFDLNKYSVLLRLPVILVRTLSSGKLTSRYTDLIYVLKKK